MKMKDLNRRRHRFADGGGRRAAAAAFAACGETVAGAGRGRPGWQSMAADNGGWRQRRPSHAPPRAVRQTAGVPALPGPHRGRGRGRGWPRSATATWHAHAQPAYLTNAHEMKSIIGSGLLCLGSSDTLIPCPRDCSFFCVLWRGLCAYRSLLLAGSAKKGLRCSVEIVEDEK